MRTLFLLILTALLLPAAALAQSGIRWSGNAKAAVDRASEMGVPVLFWVTERAEFDEDALDDLKDAQQDSFRDPIVRALIERDFVPCRVGRTSRVKAEAEKLGLPANFGLYLAVITPTGKLLAQIDPIQVTSPEALAERLAATSRAYRDSVYNEKLKEDMTDPKAAKSKVRQAVRAVWRMRIYSADKDVVGLLSRTDLTPEERSRLYQLLASFGTAPCVRALLDAAPTDKSALAALERAEPAALPTLLEALPQATGEATAQQLAAYRAAAAIAKVHNIKDEAAWAKATQEERSKEIERVKTAGDAVFVSWHEREGRWR